MVTSEQNIHGFDSVGVFFFECWDLSVGYYGLRATHTVIHEFTLKILYCTRVFSDNSFHRNVFRLLELEMCLIHVFNAYRYLSDA